MAARKLVALLAAVLQLCICQITPEVLPEFLAPLENHTVVQGRNVFFTCVVNHLQSYRVAWIKSDSRAILAIQTHLIAHNPRLSVTHNGHNTWKLHVSDVQKNDSGTYMCQVNTDPMRSQMGYMDVVIPPNIVDDDSSNGLTHEGGSVRLKCTATGSPEPNVTWKREDGRNIILRVGDRKTSVPKYEGEVLELNGVLRQEMGQYLCIATNNVPPTVSKRYFVQVNFPPLIKVPNHVLTTPLNTDVVLQCLVEASPHALNTWYRDSGTGEKLLPGDKYEMSEYPLNDYTWQMNLTVKSFELQDSGGYVCSSVNSLGNANAVVRLQVRHLTVATTPPPLSRNIDTRPRKVLKDKKKELRGSGRKSHGSSRADNPNSIGGEDDLGTTQIMAGSTQHENQRTDRPLALPSLSPPWVIANAASVRRCSAILLLLISPATIAF